MKKRYADGGILPDPSQLDDSKLNTAPAPQGDRVLDVISPEARRMMEQRKIDMEQERRQRMMEERRDEDDEDEAPRRMKKGGRVKKSSPASKRGDGCCVRGKTKGRFV
jgi:hypothetical protein